MKKVRLTINIFDYEDYKHFLRDAYQDLHIQDADISYRYLQKKAGYSTTSNHFWQVMNGRVPLSQQATQRFGRALGLTAMQLQYLSLLASMQQAKSDRDRNHYAEQLGQFSGFKNGKSNGQIRYEYYSDWYLPALREMVNLENFKEDAGWMARQLIPAITARQADRGINKLLELGYLLRDEKGVLRQTEPMIGTTDDRRDSDTLSKLAVRNFHRKMIEFGGESIDRIAQKDRFIVGATMSISLKQQAAVRKLTEDYLKQVSAIIVQDEPVEVIQRLNVQSFPLAGALKRKAVNNHSSKRDGEGE